MESNTFPADNAFRILRQTLDEISNSLISWAKSLPANSSSERMASSIAAQFELQKDFTAATLLDHTNSLSPETLSRTERYAAKSFEDLHIQSMTEVDQMRPLIDWLDMLFGMELDPGNLGVPVGELHKYMQKARQLRNGLGDLLHMFTKEQQEAHLNRQLSDTLSKLESVGLDIAKLGSLQQRSEEQSSMFSDWIQRADQKIRDFHDAEQKLTRLAEESKTASDSYAAAQSRLDAVSEETSSQKLVEHFQTFGQKHNTSTWAFFALGILVLVGAVGYSIQFALTTKLTEPVIGALSWRFAMVAGCTAIGTYLLRLASYHRRLAVWADTVQVQLQTFASYTEQIGDEASKDQLRAEFAKRVFGDEPGRSVAASDKGSESMGITELSTLIANITRLQSKP